MITLHAAWSCDSLLFWAESSEEKIPASRARKSKHHFSASAKTLSHSRRRTRHSQRTHPYHRNRVAPIK